MTLALVKCLIYLLKWFHRKESEPDRLVGPETWLSVIAFAVVSTLSKVSVACFEHLGDDMWSLQHDCLRDVCIFYMWLNFGRILSSNQYMIWNAQRTPIGVAEFQVSLVRFYLTELFGFCVGESFLGTSWNFLLDLICIPTPSTNPWRILGHGIFTYMDPINLSHSCR